MNIRKTAGPAPFAKADRSRLLLALDDALVRLGWGEGLISEMSPEFSGRGEGHALRGGG